MNGLSGARGFEVTGCSGATLIGYHRTLGLFALDDVAGRTGAANPRYLNEVDFLSDSEILEPAGQPVTYYSMSLLDGSGQ